VGFRSTSAMKNCAIGSNWILVLAIRVKCRFLRATTQASLFSLTHQCQRACLYSASPIGKKQNEESLRNVKTSTTETSTQHRLPTCDSRLIAIGDIHGHSKALATLLAQIQPACSDTIVTLGDCVNRGPDSRGVIEQLMALGKLCKLVCVLGNHEETMLDAKANRNFQQQWEDMGGIETLESYGPESSINCIPSDHWDFLESFVPHFETEDFIFVHANYNWYTPMNEQPASLLRWTSIEEEPPKAHISGKTVVLGHTPGEARDLGFCVCIDTGCGFGGPLTAIDLTDRRYLEVLTQ
jgi:serine/threonine protein phosphatase 1